MDLAAARERVRRLMVAPQAVEPHREARMMAPALFVAFAMAKAAALAGHAAFDSPWVLLMYFRQDALLALGFAVFERFVPKRVARMAFGTLAAYAAFNIPVMRAVATPLTVSMLRAAGGPLTDSFRVYATPANAVLVLA